MDVEAEIGENIWVVRPDAADCYYDIESDSIKNEYGLEFQECGCLNTHVGACKLAK